MKQSLLRAILIVLCMAPLLVLLVQDYRYNRLQDRLCQKYPAIEINCRPYRERYEREKLITTAFYRHIGAYMGRSSGTSRAFVESLRDSIIWGDATQQQANFDREDVIKQLGVFNRGLAITMFVSVALAASAATILVANIYTSTHHASRTKWLHHRDV